MIVTNESKCPRCGEMLKYFDKVKRIVRTKKQKTLWISIRRMKCYGCGSIHRELPYFITPHKQYETELIRGVLDGFITPDTIGFEDYPCEQTMERWKNEFTDIDLKK
jgi:transposase